jgi:tetratricopeptide (TPR) repeat protein
MERFCVFAGILLFASPGSAHAAAQALSLDSNETLFCVMAAINAAGYDEGMNLPDNSPLRKQVRDYLASKHIEVLPELKQYYRRHMQKTGLQDLSQFTSYAFSVTGPPDFAWKGRDVDIPPDALALDGFQPLMIDFYNQANLGELWRRVQREYDKEIARYHTPILNMTGAVDGYLRDSPLDFPTRHFHAIVELLTAPELIQTRNYGDDSYVVISPSAQPRVYDIRHSYLHFEIDPVMLTYRAALQLKRSMLDLVQTAPLDDAYKNDFVLLANESLIKAVEARLDKESSAVDRATKQGYIMTPFFAGQLPAFEGQPQSLRFYADVMIDAIDLKSEAERISTVKFDSAQLQRVAKQVTVAGPELSPAGKTLEKAESLYTDRSAAPGNLGEAKNLFEKALELKGEPAEHAQAWYGLARVAVLENRAAVAAQLFQKTLESSPDDFTRGWADVYLGRLSRAQHEYTQAAKFYQDALAVSGASDKAKQSASGELQQLSNQEKQTQ